MSGLHKNVFEQQCNSCAPLYPSAESQKGINAVKQCSIENQKGATTTDFAQRYHPSGSQQNIFELQ